MIAWGLSFLPPHPVASAPPPWTPADESLALWCEQSADANDYARGVVDSNNDGAENSLATWTSRASAGTSGTAGRKMTIATSYPVDRRPLASAASLGAYSTVHFDAGTRRLETPSLPTIVDVTNFSLAILLRFNALSAIGTTLFTASEPCLFFTQSGTCGITFGTMSGVPSAKLQRTNDPTSTGAQGVSGALPIVTGEWAALFIEFTPSSMSVELKATSIVHTYSNAPSRAFTGVMSIGYSSGANTAPACNVAAFIAKTGGMSGLKANLKAYWGAKYGVSLT